ncbi:hypothetical protein [Actinomadura rudentiformis]|uniref:Uncharacterized protein n=1 Tax=Actinomadura rudentiformis TaxID=359158 RepID=A0A6H9YMR0_9ACTN|nr:hypothetical protein [Actinomadura rudentiformis]KAB2347282.1 hypothetical protein F8566_19915 [Actinomadura rudentiformis]
MGMSVQIRTYTGSLEGTCVHPAIWALCQSAERAGLPLLGHVDRYDNTTFNRLQMKPVLAELDQIAADASPDEREAVREIVALIQQCERKPHRYLVFNGD